MHIYFIRTACTFANLRKVDGLYSSKQKEDTKKGFGSLARNQHLSQMPRNWYLILLSLVFYILMWTENSDQGWTWRWRSVVRVSALSALGIWVAFTGAEVHPWAQVPIKIHFPVEGETLQCSNPQPESCGGLAAPRS